MARPRKIDTQQQNQNVPLPNKKSISVQVSPNTWLQFPLETPESVIKKRVEKWINSHKLDSEFYIKMALNHNGVTEL